MRMRPNLPIDAAALLRLAREAARVPITAAAGLLPDIALNISASLMRYAAAHSCQNEQQPKLSDTVKWALALAEHARNILRLLNADKTGAEGELPRYVPVPGMLIDDPLGPVLWARTASQEKSDHLENALANGSAFGGSVARGDAARAAMMVEAGLQLDGTSPFGAHDVARVTVAALRQLAALADTTAQRNAMLVRTRYDPATGTLFAELGHAFSVLHDRDYAVSNTPRKAASSERSSLPDGPALRWTLALFKHAAEQAIGTPNEVALKKLAAEYCRRRDGLAKRIRETRPSPGKKRRHLCRRWRPGVKSHLP